MAQLSRTELRDWLLEAMWQGQWDPQSRVNQPRDLAEHTADTLTRLLDDQWEEAYEEGKHAEYLSITGDEY